ncbi:SagB/ThcOx family dehydrogenase [Candidatus Omnitrophota bacterium]
MKPKILLILSTVFLFACFINLQEVVMAELTKIQLPEPVKQGKMSVEEAILNRRSVRNFTQRDLGWPEISQLLWAAQGITAKKGSLSLRSAPSAGALYPLEIYLFNSQGMFHYLPQSHKLEVLAEGDLRSVLCEAALSQASVAQAAVDIVICAVPQRVTAKYGERGMKYVYIEAGHVAQNIHLAAVALGLDSLPVGAFSDEQVSAILSLPAEQEPVYIIPVGYAQ